MSDWHGMEAGEPLNRLIAERRGFHPHYVTGKNVPDGWCLIDPEGHTYGYVPAPTADEAWDFAPSLSTDLSSAWVLFKGLPPNADWRLYRRFDPPGCIAEIHVYEGLFMPSGDFSGEAEKPAPAVCRAWLAYDDANRDAR